MKCLVDTICGRDGTGQFVNVSLLRRPIDFEPLYAAEFEERPQKVAFTGRVVCRRRLHVDRYLHCRPPLGRPQCAHQALEVDGGHSHGVPLIPAFLAGKLDRHFQDGRFHFAPEIVTSGNRKPMIPQVPSNPCLIEADEGPKVLELEERLGLVMDLTVGEKDGCLIANRIRATRYTSNGSERYLTWLDGANTVCSLAGEGKTFIEVRYVGDDVFCQQNKPVYLVPDLSGKAEKGKMVLHPLLFGY